MSTVKVTHLGDDRFSIEVRSHELAVDQPVEAGGTDTAPTPTELFVVSLASCVAHYARRYLARHDLTTDGLEVTAAYEMATGPSRVSAIRVQVSISDEVPHERRAALLAVASHCTVHNSLSQPPSVQVTIDAAPVAAPSR